ncbi:hypothetical protein CCHL11_01128 [Colletotrichum chlorophyti]|uniref:E3 ubiquitin-protein ligase CCNB1IP1 n=1 Tax=Colletotrichum chlorophyti TaxID=708187 RepID=A0A1Q8S815_9PEZI|nr:hypothetical protein CCHL11_01128 [Colletotrichum chlorophyti]
MECAGRALSFWAYQTTQEITYQRYLENTLIEKLKTLNQRYEQSLSMAEDRNDMRRKHEELGHVYQDKCRKLLQVQELYDKVKRKAELGQMEAAVTDAVDSNLEFGPRISNAMFPELTKRRAAGFPQTPYGNTGVHDVRSFVRSGLSTVSEPATGTLLGCGPAAAAQGSLLHRRQPPIPQGRGLGLGISSGIRTSRMGPISTERDEVPVHARVA